MNGVTARQSFHTLSNAAGSSCREGVGLFSLVMPNRVVNLVCYITPPSLPTRRPSFIGQQRRHTVLVLEMVIVAKHSLI